MVRQDVVNGETISEKWAWNQHYFHCNWGWGGDADGWYFSWALNPANGPEDYRDLYEYEGKPDIIHPIDADNGGQTNTDAGHYSKITSVYHAYSRK